MFGQFLYQLTPRDAQQAQLEWVAQRRLQTGAQVNFNALAIMPPEKFFFLVAAAFAGVGGAAQNVIRHELIIVDEAGNTLINLWRRASPQHFAAAGTISDEFEPGQAIPLFPGYRLRFETEFSAGAVANTTAHSLIGYFIPRGTVGQSGMSTFL